MQSLFVSSDAGVAAATATKFSLHPPSSSSSSSSSNLAFSFLNIRRLPSRWSLSAALHFGDNQDHYSVLGLPRTASPSDVKKAYRLLARKYHPDVSQHSQADEIFKSIHLAYEVLSDEVRRARYDMKLKFPLSTSSSWMRKKTYKSESDKRRAYRWEELRQRMKYERQNNKNSTWYYRTESNQETSHGERGSFGEVLRFAFFTFLFMRTIGIRASLALCGTGALLDRQLDIGYKMGYVIALFLGGQGGILLVLCINFASWLWGKKSSSLVVLVVVAMLIGANIARFVPVPRGALLTLLYMCMKLQVEAK